MSSSKRLFLAWLMTSIIGSVIFLIVSWISSGPKYEYGISKPVQLLPSVFAMGAFISLPAIFIYKHLRRKQWPAPSKLWLSAIVLLSIFIIAFLGTALFIKIWAWYHNRRNWIPVSYSNRIDYGNVLSYSACLVLCYGVPLVLWILSDKNKPELQNQHQDY